MMISEAIGRIDSLMHNTYSDHDKRKWLSNVDGQIKLQLVDTHDGASGTPFRPYGDQDYLQAQMHYHNGEFDRYNNAIAMFQSCFDSFANHYRRTHTPRGVSIRYF